MKKLFVDDLRNPPDDTWDIARTFHKAIVMIEENHYDVISLDNDLGCYYGNREMMGYDILQWLIMHKQSGFPHFYMPKTILVHSANPVQSTKMKEDIIRWFEE